MARTTELHPDGECMHRPPRGETPGGRDQSQRRAPPPPEPCLATNPPTTELNQGAHLEGKSGGKESREGRGGGAQEGWATVSCEVSCIVRPAASGTGNRVHPFSHVHSSHSLR